MLASMDRESRLRELHAAFNGRDIDTALAGMTKDVDWLHVYAYRGDLVERMTIEAAD